MCDEITENDNSNFAAAGGQMNRRDITKLSAASLFLAACTPTVSETGQTPVAATSQASAAPLSVVEADVDVPMAEGVSDSYYVRPATGNHPGCLLYTSPSPRDLSTSRMPSSA